MRTFRTILALTCWLCITPHPVWSQTPLSFYPYAQGNVWQYRDASTQEILYRRYNDSVSIGADSNIYIQARYVPGQLRQERIDTAFNLYLTTFQPDHPRYKLAADSGETWVAGYFPGDSTRYIEVSVTDVYQGNFSFCGPSPNIVFTTIKELTFNMIQFGGTDTIELGREYLAAGFGLVFALIEGGSAPCLSGATIDGVHWGEPIVSVYQTADLPVEFSLHQNYPNPFNSSTMIPFRLTRPSTVNVTIFSMLGQKVATLLSNAPLDEGEHTLVWNASGQPSGVYIYRLESGTQVISRKMLLMK
jgi:hypothetical protein